MSKKPMILVVDDQAENTRLLEAQLAPHDYDVLKALSAKETLAILETNHVDLIILDIMMPDVDGFELCVQLKKDQRFKNIPIIFVTALSETVDKVKAFSLGAVDYITKPFEREEVLARVATHIKIRKLQTEMEELVFLKTQEISESQMATIFTLANLAELRDHDTGRHLDRVRSYCRVIALKLMEIPKYKPQVDLAFIKNIYYSSPLHDIGKIAIPDSILLKEGKLTEEEFEVMKTHTTIGAVHLKDVNNNYPNNSFIKMGIDIALSHHERWDGKGYPNALEKENIPLCARIMAIADVYDALRSKRPYKSQFSHERSIEIITEGIGKNFDPDLANIFLSIQNKILEITLHFKV